MTDKTVETYKGYVAVLIALCLILAGGWLFSAKKPVDSNNLTTRIATCQDLTSASENEVCSKALTEVQVLLAEYDTALSKVPQSVLTSWASGATAPTATTSTSTATTTR